ncbi:MAG: NACHT domain-containing protein [Cyanobacteria bacterium P01_D01_bin.56]
MDQTPAGAAKSLNRAEYKWRRVLLGKVKQDWIDGILAQSLHTQVPLELGLEERADYVPNPIKDIEYVSPGSRNVLSESASVANIFQDIGVGRTLLILGDPGAGKTVTLLKLAKSLLARTDSDLSQPLPVVLNLSSWARKRPSMADWLVQELYERYGVPQAQAKPWVEREQLTLLLDGLDKVDARCRDECVNALNQFIAAHHSTKIVVCSRIRDYENLGKPLNLGSAVYIRPLTLQQIERFLESGGKSLAPLKRAIKQNTDLQELLSSPAMVSLVSLVCQECSVDIVLQPGTAEEPRRRLLDMYIDRMLPCRGATQQYSSEQTRRWLIQIAQRLEQSCQTVFLIERMQPNWFQSQRQRIRYRLESGLLVGLIFGPIFGLLYGLIDGLLYGLEGGLLYGLRDGLLYGFLYGLRDGWLIFGLVAGLVVGFAGNIKTVETLRWSWRAARNSSLRGLMIGLMAVPGLWWFMWKTIEPGVLLVMGLIYVLAAGPILGLIFGSICGFRGPKLQKTSKPNQGIWRSARNALIFGLIFGLIGELAGGFDSGLSFGISSFFIGMLSGGGTACLRHFSLRLMFARMGNIPWNYAHFLDYATERLFLQKVGGGYIFIHPMLLEHFAAMEPEPTKRI